MRQIRKAQMCLEQSHLEFQRALVDLLAPLKVARFLLKLFQPALLHWYRVGAPQDQRVQLKPHLHRNPFHQLEQAPRQKPPH